MRFTNRKKPMINFPKQAWNQKRLCNRLSYRLTLLVILPSKFFLKFKTEFRNSVQKSFRASLKSRMSNSQQSLLKKFKVLSLKQSRTKFKFLSKSQVPKSTMLTACLEIWEIFSLIALKISLKPQSKRKRPKMKRASEEILNSSKIKDLS